MKALTPRQCTDLTLGFGVILLVRSALDGPKANGGITAAGAVLLIAGGIWRSRMRGL
jgi:hypothetical protein